MKVRLLTISLWPGASGQPGDVLDVDGGKAAELLEAGVAELVEQPKPVRDRPKPKADADSFSAFVESQEPTTEPEESETARRQRLGLNPKPASR